MTVAPAALDPFARQILDTARDAFIAMDVSGRIAEWNVAAERLLGWTREQAVGSELADLIVPPALRSAHRGGLLRYLTTGEAHLLNRTLQVAAQHRDGHEVPVALTITSLRVRSEVFFNAFVRDLRPAPPDRPPAQLGAAPVVPREREGEMLRAIERTIRGEQGLRLVVQPIVDLARGVVCGYEALSRFSGPPDATPDVWFAAAGTAGLSGVLEARAVQAALERRAGLPPNCFLSLNVSPHALAAPEVRDVFAQAGGLGGVVVEITEQSVVEDYASLHALLDPLREAGAMVAVDDAGAGYASLSHVLALRPDLVKLDRSLADGVDRDPAKAAVVEMLGGLAGRLDAWLLAEGIEREAELDTLVKLGVPLAQGYLLARPADEFVTAIPDALAEGLRARREPPSAGTVAMLVEPVARVREDDSGLGLPAGEDLGIVVDAAGRPLALVRRGPHGILRGLSAVMTVLPQASVRDVVLRALARPETERFDALACHDEVGRLLGIVRLERLIAHLAGEP
jgi:PAS domain S-box-containing protein